MSAPRRLGAALVLLVSVLLAGAGASGLARPAQVATVAEPRVEPSAVSEAPAVTPTPSPSVTPSTSPSPVRPAPSPTPEAGPVPSAAPSPAVPPPAPAPSTAPVATATKARPATGPGEIISVTIPETGFKAPGGTLRVGNTGTIDPPDFERVFRVVDRGVAPSANAADTVYLACHTHSQRTAATVPCNALPSTAAKGQHLVLTTTSGTLSYTVTQVRSITKSQLASDAQVWAVQPGGLVLITCIYSNGKTTDKNLVIFATVDR